MRFETDEKQMVKTLSVRIFWLGIWTTFQDVLNILEMFRLGGTKIVLPLTSQPNFRNFLVNGKQPFYRGCAWAQKRIISHFRCQENVLDSK